MSASEKEIRGVEVCHQHVVDLDGHLGLSIRIGVELQDDVRALLHGAEMARCKRSAEEEGLIASHCGVGING